MISENENNYIRKNYCVYLWEMTERGFYISSLIWLISLNGNMNCIVLCVCYRSINYVFLLQFANITFHNGECQNSFRFMYLEG